MNVFLRAIPDMSLETDLTEIDQAPQCKNSKFIAGALTACINAPLRVRTSIQSDIAHTLGCHVSDLTFLWAHPVRGAEVLDCEIPDFRDSFLQPIALQVASE